MNPGHRLHDAMSTTDRAFETALAHHRAGRYADAAALYQQVVRDAPRHADALHLLGVASHQTGQHESAAMWIERAIAVRGDDPAFHANLGEVYSAQGRLAEAVACYQRALAQHPERGEFHFALGVLHQRLCQFEQAAAAYSVALRIDPRHAMALNNLGTLLKDAGQTEEALSCFAKAMDADPKLAEPYYNVALVHTARCQLDLALAAYREALAREPSYLKVLVNYGNLLERRGRLDEARACYERIVAAHPQSPVGYVCCGNVHRAQGLIRAAIDAYQKAIRVQPDFARAYNNLGVVFLEIGQADAAEKSARQGLQHAPHLGELHSTLASALLLEGRLDESLTERRKAVELLPDSPGEHSNLVYDLCFLPDVDSQSLFAEHLAWAKRHAEPLTKSAAPHVNVPDAVRRLRVGYVSAYFREHAVNYFTEPILASHDHRQFEIYCYSDVTRPDEATARIKAATDVWRDTASLSDEQLADVVRNDAIDILVDLTGHIGFNRLPLFARWPAPVQVTYIGYQNTTGMSAMDYRLTDAHADPPGETDRYYTEKLVRLPGAFFVYRPPDDAPATSPLPALSQGHVTFGSFNKFNKVTAPTLEIWLKILASVPASRLLVLAERDGHVQNRLHHLATSRGVDPTRIELFDRQQHADYLQLVARADIALDPFPFNGHTTTCDALWMGVPVVTLAGRTYAARFGSSAHVNLGLESWVARSPEEYQEIATRAAADLPALAKLRAELRPRMQGSPLLDFIGFTRNLETAYREMWRTWCARKS